MTTRHHMRHALTAILLTSNLLVVGSAWGQGNRPSSTRNGTSQLSEIDQNVPGSRDYKQQQETWAKDQKRLPANIKDFITQELGRKPDEMIEISEISDALNKFERKNKKLIPDRDVLETESMTARQLVEALNQRVNRDPSGVNPTPSIPIEGGTREKEKNLLNADAFQRQALLNNPDGILRKSKEGLTDGSGRYYDSGSARNTGRLNIPPPNNKDIVARAILSVRPDFADPRIAADTDFARYKLSNQPIAAPVYTRLQRRFQNDLAHMKTSEINEQWAALDIAIQRIQLAETSEAYSNGAWTRDKNGNKIYPNGKRMFDDNGRPMYPNGKRKFDSDGNELHSNGRRMYNANGVKLYANGQPQEYHNGVDLFNDGSKTKNDRGVSLYDNGRAKVNVERSMGQRLGPGERPQDAEAGYDPTTGKVERIEAEAVPLDPRSRPQVRQGDGVVLYDNGQAKTNRRGVEMYRNGQTKVSTRGVELYDNGRRSENNRGRALTYNSSTIGAREGFQGRPNGIYPIVRIVSGRIKKVTNDRVEFIADGTGEEESVSLDGAFVGTEGKDVLPADPAKIPPNTRGHVVIEQDWRYVDGLAVGASGPPRLLAIFTASGHARREMEDGVQPILKLINGRVSQATESALTITVPNNGSQPEEFNMTDAIAQKTTAGKVTPIDPASLGQGRSVTLLVQTNGTFEKGKLTALSPPQVLFAWQEGPRAP